MNSRRLFVAVPASKAVCARLSALQEALRESLARVRWVREDGMHVTLQFLGAADEALLQKVEEALAEVDRSALHRCELKCMGLGVFPSVRQARVVWAGLGGNAEALETLACNVARALRPLGFQPERRPFTPHITLGRIRGGERPDLLEQALEAHKGEDFGSFALEKFSLFESILHPDGAQYKELRAYPLRAD